jgi:hypothetical protein
MLVHHMNADGKKLRGHTSIHANVDQVVLITQDEETKIRTAKLVKQKDDEDGLKIPFALMAVPVGMNAKTEREITSCVVLSVSEKDRLKKEQERQGFYVNPTERRILINLFDTVDRHGQFVATEADGPRAAIGKIIVNWKDYLAVAHEKMIEEPDKEKATARITKEFTRAKDSLIKFGVIGLDKPYMWWVGKPIRGFARTFPRKDQADLLENAQAPTDAERELQEMQNRGEEVIW